MVADFFSVFCVEESADEEEEEADDDVCLDFGGLGLFAELKNNRMSRCAMNLCFRCPQTPQHTSACTQRIQHRNFPPRIVVRFVDNTLRLLMDDYKNCLSVVLAALS